MKVLHIGIPIYSLSREFAKHCDYRYIDWTAWTAIPGNLHNMYKEVLSAAKEFKPDLVFMQIQAPGIISGEFLDDLRPHAKRIVNWTWDIRTPTPQWILDIASKVDVTGFTNEDDVTHLRSLGHNAEFLQSGFDHEVFDIEGDFSDYPEIVFVGNNYPPDEYDFPLSQYRRDMVSHLERRYGPRFGVYGFGWANPMQNFMYRESKEASCYRSSKVAINLSHYVATRYSSDRILRLMGSGGMCLAQWYPGIDKDFVDGVHLRTWNSFDELDSLIDYYTDDSNRDERNRIALSGCELVHKNYTWGHMVDKLETLIQNTHVV